MPLEPESEATRVARDLKVLMADDDPAQLMLSEAALAGAGFLVYTVGDASCVTVLLIEKHMYIFFTSLFKLY